MTRPTVRPIELHWITRLPATWRVWVTKGGISSGQVYFNDGDYGSIEKALAAAAKFRDKFVAKHHVVRREYTGSGFHLRHKNSSSGIVGVSIGTYNLDDMEKAPRINWRARVRDDYKDAGRSFSILRHGYAAAWQMAASVRCAHSGQDIPAAPPPPPAWMLPWAQKRGYDGLAHELKLLTKKTSRGHDGNRNQKRKEIFNGGVDGFSQESELEPS